MEAFGGNGVALEEDRVTRQQIVLNAFLLVDECLLDDTHLACVVAQLDESSLLPCRVEKAADLDSCHEHRQSDDDGCKTESVR